MHQRSVAGFPTWWRQSGRGERKALFIHCSLAHSGAWAPVQRLLDDRLDMLSFDMPGHGQSGDWDRRGDFQSVTAEIAAELITAPTDLIAHSFGATVALRLARDHPRKVRSLTLVEPVLFAAARHLPAYAEHMRELAPFGAAIGAEDWEQAARAFNSFWGNGMPWADLPAVQRQSMVNRIHLIPKGAPVTNEDIHGQAAPGALEELDLPVLLIEGAQSPAIVTAVHDVLEARLPHARRMVVSGAGHMVPITHPEVIARRIGAFLDNFPVT